MRIPVTHRRLKVNKPLSFIISTVLGISTIALILVGFGCVEERIPVINDLPAPAVKSTEVTDYTITAQPSDSTTLTTTPAKDRTWISPGKVSVGNYYAGATADWTMTIHNGKPIPAQFAIAYRTPDYTADGYSMPLSAAQDWVIIADTAPLLKPYETREVKVTLQIPAKTKSIMPKWEYWISVIDKSQQGNVTTELCSRWLVTMR
jgi:hypothetical protein